MNTCSRFFTKSTLRTPTSQRGATTMMITIVLLSVLLLVSLFASRFQISEHRASVNKVRATMSNSVAESAINQGLEYLKANARFVNSDKEALGATPAGWLSATSPSWIPCTTPVSTGVFDPCLAEPDEDKRNQMYRFSRAGVTRFPLENMFPEEQLYDQVGGRFDSTYNVYATLCRLDIHTNPAQPTCALEPPQEGPIAVNVVAHGALPNQNASTTIKSIIATSRTIASPPNVPLIAAGIVSGLGSAEIVPNPNSGGFGVPLSIWTNSNVDITKEAGGSGSFATCHLGEFLTNYSSGGPEQYDGITRCTTCTCSGLPPDRGLLSGKDPSTPGYEGIDIMDIDGNTNGDLPDATFFPREPLDNPNNRFDDSVFEYTFGVDVVDEGETAVRMTCISDENPTGNCENQFLIDANATILPDCSSLDADSSGVYWIVGNCDINQQVGTPSFPVALIVDKCLSVRASAEIYGLLYTRGGQPGGCANPDETFSAAGGGQIYGAVVSDGGVKIRGSVQMIYNETVLTNLGNSSAFQRFGFLPGSWSDDVCQDSNGLCTE